VKLVRALLVLMASVTNGQDYGASRGGQEVALPSRGTIWLSFVTQHSGDFEHVYVTFTSCREVSVCSCVSFHYGVALSSMAVSGDSALLSEFIHSVMSSVWNCIPSLVDSQASLLGLSVL